MNNCLLQQIVQPGSSFVGSLDERLNVISKGQQVKTFIPSPDYIPLRTFLRANINILARWFKIMKIISRSPYWKRNLIFIVTLDRSRSAGTQIVIRWGEVCSPDSQLSGAINILHLWYCAFVLCELHCSIAWRFSSTIIMTSDMRETLTRIQIQNHNSKQNNH